MNPFSVVRSHFQSIPQTRTTSPAIGNYSLYWEYHNGTGVLSPYSYADVAAYSALEMNRRGNTTGTLDMLSVLSSMWDGKGVVDEPFKAGPGIYHSS